FGWSRTAVTGAITTGTILAGLVSLPFGKLVDRYGTRWLTSLGAVVAAGMYVLMTKFVELWQFYVVFVMARVISMGAVTNIAPRTAAVNWFRRYRGRALGLLSMATPLGASMLAMIAQFIMQDHGWRTVFLVFALAMLFLQALPAALILRRRPEDLGLVPDGGPSVDVTPASSLKRADEEESDWTLSEAIRTPTMWLLIAAIIVGLIVNTGIGFHLVAYYTDIGIAPSIAVGALSLYAFTGALGNIIWGFLSERFSERFLASVVMVLTAATILYLQSVRTITGAFIFAALFGLTSRGEGTLVNIILAQYYGRSSYGAINGFVMPFHNLGLGFGPLISSVSFDLTGSYQTLFSVFIGASMIAAVLFWLSKKPTLPVRNTSSPLLQR
ncbi:MAG: MFS transporter, partial [Desulfobacterales bacterium]|nr:MFS transporter [Desulfobacterales bacterium]